MEGLDPSTSTVNYFLGSDPQRWRPGILTFGKVRYRELLPGIDLVFYGNQRQLEYDFVVAAGADPSRIELQYQGVQQLDLDEEGGLVLTIEGGAMRQHKPRIYQNVNGSARDVAGGYVVKEANRVGFEVAAYDPRLPLIIDPGLGYSTYLRGSGDEQVNSISLDGAGSSYVIGQTSTNDFPTTPGAYDTTYPVGDLT